MSAYDSALNRRRRLWILLSYLLNRKVFFSTFDDRTYPMIDMKTKKGRLCNKKDLDILCSSDMMSMDPNRGHFILTAKGCDLAHERLKESGGEVTFNPIIAGQLLTKDEINEVYYKKEKK